MVIPISLLPILCVLLLISKSVAAFSSSKKGQEIEDEHIVCEVSPAELPPCLPNELTTSHVCYAELMDTSDYSTSNVISFARPVVHNPAGESSPSMVLEGELLPNFLYTRLSAELWVSVNSQSDSQIIAPPTLEVKLSSKEISEESLSSQETTSYAFSSPVVHQMLSDTTWFVFSFNGIIILDESKDKIEAILRFNYPLESDVLIKSLRITQLNQLDPFQSKDQLDTTADIQMIPSCIDDKYEFNFSIMQCVFNLDNRCSDGRFESITSHACTRACAYGEYEYALDVNHAICLQSHEICDQQDLIGCATCDRFGAICFACNEGYHLLQGEFKCVQSSHRLSSSNTAMRILSGFSGNCIRPQCKSCIAGSCYECAAPFVLFHGQCLLCGIGLQRHYGHCTIKLSDNGCSNKLDWSSTCQGCLPGLSAPSASTASNCLQHLNCISPSFDLNPSGCGNCAAIPDCLTCLTSDICLTCSDGKFLMIEDYYQQVQKVKCTSSCPDGFYLYYGTDSPAICRPCMPFCENCSGDSTCTGCFNGYSIVSGNCVPSNACPENCQTCSNSTTCTNCMTGYTINPTNQQCEKCDTECVTCAYEATLVCTLCHDGTTTPTCLAKVCPQKQYVDISQNCQSCSSNCLTCVDGVSCKVCLPGYVSEPALCSQCSSNCKVCKDVNICIACDVGYMLSGRVCVANTNQYQCTVGQFHDGSVCQSCGITCKTCSDAVACVECANGLIPSLGTCGACSPTQYLNSARTCVECGEHCTSCSSPNGCTSCDSGYFQSGGVCVRISVCGDNDRLHPMVIGGSLVLKQCDDTGVVSGDGCSATCQIEAMFTCDDSSGKSVCTRFSICGDGDFTNTMFIGWTRVSKQCDDMNTSSNDGCSATCQIEPQYICALNAYNYSTCTHYSVCGDRNIATKQLLGGSLQFKQCDDGNTASGDGCDSNCQVETNYLCPWNGAASLSVCKRHSICGDGDFSAPQIRGGVYESKQCDDLNTTSGDGCSSDCQIELMYTCVNSAGHIKNLCQRYSQCGDLDFTNPIINSSSVRQSKQCDDGNAIAGDGCDSYCQVEQNHVCLLDSMALKSVCTRVSVCGDKNMIYPLYLGAGEFKVKQCDDGNTLNHDGCNANCQIEPGFVCSFNANQISVCTQTSLQNSFSLFPYTDPVSKLPNVSVRFLKQISNGKLRMLRTLASQADLVAYINAEMIVTIEKVEAAKYSYDVVLHDDEKGVNIVFDVHQNVLDKKVSVNFLPSFASVNNLGVSQGDTPFPNTRPVSENQNAATKATADILKVIATLFQTFVIPIIFFAKFSMLFNALDLFQMIYYLKYVSPRIPANMMQFLINMGSFSVPFKLNFIRLFMEINPVDPIEIPETYKNDRITGVYLDSAGDYISKLIVIACVHVLLLQLAKLFQKSSVATIVKVGKTLEEKLNTSWKWGWYLNFYWEIFLRLIVGIALQTYGLNISSFQAAVNSVCFLLSIIVTFLSPFYFMRKLKLNEEKIDEKEFKIKFGMLYESLKVKSEAEKNEDKEILKNNSSILAVKQSKDEIVKVNPKLNRKTAAAALNSKMQISSATATSKKDETVTQHTNAVEKSSSNESETITRDNSSDWKLKYSKYFFLFLYVRKILYGLFVVLLWESTIAQIFFMNVVNGLVACYILIISPYESKADNRKGLVCELLLIIAKCTILFLIEDDPESNETDRYNIGWVFIMICSTIIIIQFVFIVFNLLKKIVEEIKEYLKKRKEAKAIIPLDASSVSFDGTEKPQDLSMSQDLESRRKLDENNNHSVEMENKKFIQKKTRLENLVGLSDSLDAPSAQSYRHSQPETIRGIVHVQSKIAMTSGLQRKQ